MIELIEGVDIGADFFCDFTKGSVFGNLDEHLMSGVLRLGRSRRVGFILWLQIRLGNSLGLTLNGIQGRGGVAGRL